MTVTMLILTVTDKSIFPVDRHGYRTTIVVVTMLSLCIPTVTMLILTVTDQSIFPVDRHTYRTTIAVVTVLSRCIPTARYPIVILLVAASQS